MIFFFLKKKKIVHGNISSRAVLLRRERGGVLSVVLGGWTVAGSLTGEGLSSSCVSSSAWRYASPERVLELGGASKADDVWACGSVLWELLGESSLTPLVAPARRELGARLSALLRWEELRAAANNWLRALPQERARAAAAALQRALDDNAASASLREQLSERMAAPSAVALLLRLLSWDAAQRGAAHAALLDPWLQHAPPRQTPRHLDHPSALSDHALQAWIRAIRQ